MAVTAADAGEDILFERRGALGLITLNRPKALNALTHAMALALEVQLDAWAADERVLTVAIQGAGDRAFCAGGDIRALYEGGRPGRERGRANFAFYADEYRLNWKIHHFPKPYIAIMDGIVMGGGVGVSIHGSHRIATERTVFAMPETGIGLFPDVGATWFLPRLKGETGLWLGLTGARLKGGDAVAGGVCDRLIPSHRVDWLIDWLAEGRWEQEPQGRALNFSGEEEATGGALGGHIAPQKLSDQSAIDRAFAARSLDGLLERLEGMGDDWAEAQRAAIRSKSPTCTALAFRQIRAGAALSFEDCMALEYRLARFCMTHGDFYEGVRATIIEKGGTPAWQPATLEAIDPAVIEAAFAPLGEEELQFRK
ncbi:MAG: enoyl-CoA hydratase/isomerase family protein [Pseudomonadota bacterium]